MAAEGRALDVLVVDDSQDDVLLVVRQLRQYGFSVNHRRVDREAQLLTALEQRGWDVVLCDYNLPSWSMWRVLEVVRGADTHVPFIVISGAINPDTAAEVMARGAQDYVMKNELARLGPAVARELEEASVRRDRLRLSDRLRAHELQTQAILDSSADAIVSIDADGTVLSINRTGEEMFGYAASELLGRPVTTLMPEPHRSRHGGYVAGFLRHGVGKGMGTNRGLTALRKDGREVPVAITIRQLVDTAEPVFIGTIQDLTEIRRLELEAKQLASRLQQAEKLEAIGTMASSVAHDLANFVAPIAFYAEVLKQPTLDEGTRRETAEAIGAVVEQAQQLVGQVLSFARPHANAPGELDLALVVRDAVTAFRATLSPGLSLQLSVPDSPVPAIGNESQMHQILNNLLSNAAAAIGSRAGEIRVELQRTPLQADDTRLPAALLPGDYALLRVSDSGRGIDPEILPKIFDPFFSTRLEEHGTGLGLATVKRIVKACGGDVGVSSTPGAGSMFTVTLPVDAG